MLILPPTVFTSAPWGALLTNTLPPFELITTEPSSPSDDLLHRENPPVKPKTLMLRHLKIDKALCVLEFLS